MLKIYICKTVVTITNSCNNIRLMVFLVILLTGMLFIVHIYFRRNKILIRVCTIPIYDVICAPLILFITSDLTVKEIEKANILNI